MKKGDNGVAIQDLHLHPGNCPKKCTFRFNNCSSPVQECCLCTGAGRLASSVFRKLLPFFFSRLIFFIMFGRILNSGKTNQVCVSVRLWNFYAGTRPRTENSLCPMKKKIVKRWDWGYKSRCTPYLGRGSPVTSSPNFLISWWKLKMAAIFLFYFCAFYSRNICVPKHLQKEISIFTN